MSLSKKAINYLNSIPDSVFIFWIWNKYGSDIPQWKRVTKEEYEKHCGKPDGIITIKKLEKMAANLFQGIEYRAVWNRKLGIRIEE